APQAPPPDWAAAAAPPPPDEAELRSELGSRFDSYQAPEAGPPAPPAREPADDRLSALSGIFGPPTQEAPPPPPAESWTTPDPAGRARGFLERAARRVQQRQVRQGARRGADGEPAHASRRAGRSHRPAAADRRRSHRRPGARARSAERPAGRALPRVARPPDLRRRREGLRQGQGEEGVQGRAAADLPRRRLGAAGARCGGQAPQG